MNTLQTKIGALILLALLLAAAPAYADKNTGVLVASAVVKEVMSATTLYQLPTLQVNREDIDRGYLEVRDATVMEVRTNSRNGYYLSFEGEANLFSDVLVMEQGRKTMLANGRGMVHQSAMYGLKGEKKAISYRFYLAKDAKPGVYSFPLMVTVAFN